MKKIVIVYESVHQRNTKKLVKAISERYNLTLIDAKSEEKIDLFEYDIIGFASGIDFGKFYPNIEQCLKENLPENKNVFFMYTCAKPNKKFTQAIKTEALKKNANILGEYGCKGYNTYGPWKLIGGINKHHPDDNDISGAIKFFENIINK